MEFMNYYLQIEGCESILQHLLWRVKQNWRKKCTFVAIEDSNYEPHDH